MCLHLVILIDVFTLKAKFFISKRKTNSILPTDQVISDQQILSTETAPPPPCLNMEIGDLVRYRNMMTRIVEVAFAAKNVVKPPYNQTGHPPAQPENLSKKIGIPNL